MIAIKKRTTLILGAGASAPYGYPLGIGLRDELLRGPTGFDQRLRDLSIDAAEWADVQAALYDYQKPSVDEFMSAYPEHSQLMKLAIAHELNRFESHIQHTNPSHKDPWYRVLLDDYLGDDMDFGSGILTIVTFNYDLSLEKYLIATSKARHRGRTDEQRQASLAHLNIQHIYGHLGPVIDIHGTGRQYAEFPNAAAARAAAENISTCFEEGSCEAVAKAQEQVSESDVVSFLGFGYSTQNLQRLDLKSHLKKGAAVVGSDYKCGNVQNLLRPFLPDGVTAGACGSGDAGAVTVGLLRSMFNGNCG
jgi:hypothetical protein